MFLHLYLYILNNWDTSNKFSRRWQTGEEPFPSWRLATIATWLQLYSIKREKEMREEQILYRSGKNHKYRHFQTSKDSPLLCQSLLLFGPSYDFYIPNHHSVVKAWLNTLVLVHRGQFTINNMNQSCCSLGRKLQFAVDCFTGWRMEFGGAWFQGWRTMSRAAIGLTKSTWTVCFVGTHRAMTKERVSGPQVNRRNRAPYTPPCNRLPCLSSWLQYPVSFLLPAQRPTALQKI